VFVMVSRAARRRPRRPSVVHENINHL